MKLIDNAIFASVIAKMVNDCKAKVPDSLSYDEELVKWLEDNLDDEYKSSYLNASEDDKRSARYFSGLLFGQCLAEIFNGKWIPFSNIMQDWGIETLGDSRLTFRPFNTIHKYLMKEPGSGLLQVITAAKLVSRME